MSSDAQVVVDKAQEPETSKVAQPEETNASGPAAPPEEPSNNDDEPQNSLTKKFTAQEWEAVKQLRAKLPEVSEAVYKEKSKIVLWGVELSTTPSAKASVVLVKFIRARPGDVAAAQQMLISTLKWREEFRADATKDEEFSEVFSAVGVISGTDKEGRPVTYNFYGSTDPNIVFKDVDQFIRWRVGLMEKGIKLIDFETVDSMVQVHDYAGVSLMGGRTANSKAAAKRASQLFSDYYPELLHKKFFVSVPTVLTWIFWTFTTILSPATQAKMSVVGSGPDTILPALLPVIDKNQIPKRYGGDGGSV